MSGLGFAGEVCKVFDIHGDVKGRRVVVWVGTGVSGGE